MKVILIHKPKDIERLNRHFDFTIGKLYEIELHNMHFKIQDDSGNMINLSHYFLKSEFMEIEVYRDNKIKQLIDV